MTDLKQLIKTRGVIKTKLTRFKTYFNSVSNISEITQLKIRLSKLEECWSDFDIIQLQIELEDDSDIQFEERDKFESEYFSITSAAQDFIKTHETQLYSDNVHETKPILSQPVSVKLPDIKLPVFSGNYDEWVSFHDTFVSLIHSKEMSEIHKFHYLRCSLKGEATEILASLEGSAENYKIAWKLLNDRFGNKRFLINKHVSALFNLSKSDKENSLSLRKLLDSALKHIRALSGLGQPTTHWDTLLIHVITTKLDPTTLRDWENSLKINQLPTMSELETFLHHKCQVLESVETSKSQKVPVNNQFSNRVQSQNFKSFNKNNAISTNFHVTTKNCSLCNQPQHAIYFCKTFKSLSIPDRELEVKKRGLCFNCLNSQHKSVDCQSGSCKHCGKKHNSLLHYNKPNTSGSSTPALDNDDKSSKSCQQQTIASMSNVNSKEPKAVVMLSTAVVSVVDKYGCSHLCRALLDSGSQSNFITEKTANILRLPSNKNALEISGIGKSSTITTHSVECMIKSRVNQFSAYIECVVLPTITQNLPTVQVVQSALQLPQNIQLADPEFHKPSAIDMLIGAELFYEILCEGRFKAGDANPTIQNTQFGWVVSGKLQIDNQKGIILTSVSNLSTLEVINENIQKFWELEECNSEEKRFTGNDKLCEDIYNNTTSRFSDGRFCVKIPLKGDVNQLGESRPTAIRRLLSLEKRLDLNEELKLQYVQFMREYETLGHMTEISSNEVEASKSYFIPHHCVIKEDSMTSRVRVVFDASCKTTSGVSLNDLSIVGPTVQSDLISTIIRFRKHAFAMTSDIEKMYRQILIHPSQTNLQLIVWRENPDEKIKTYKLLTVTYGTASAPYLATRTLKQLALDEKETLPQASLTMIEDFYVDDLMTGANTLQEAKQLQKDLIELASHGGFHLRKWCANNPELLSNIPSKDVRQTEYNIDQDPRVKTLGLIWNPVKDSFQFLFHKECKNKQPTKRSILASIGRIFDPLGLIGPVIVTAKLIMQSLWCCKVGWDDEIPRDLVDKWNEFHESIHLLTTLEIPRCITFKSEVACTFEIHGFSDASESAYGACIYLKSISASNDVTINLITSKSRVAPLRRVSLPRLELCGALLLSELSKITISSLKLQISSVNLYTDSTIVLAWIRAPSSYWTTFVANRVAKIQDNTNIESWRYVPTDENPADFLSRGLLPHQLCDNELYWKGPQRLMEDNLHWDLPKEINSEIIPERRAQVSVHCTVTDNSIFSKFSSFTKTIRMIAYCLRFLNNCQSHNNRLKCQLSIQELEKAEIKLLQLIQNEIFFKEINDLKLFKPVHSSSQLKSLNPYLDTNSIIRVGGRLQNSNLHCDQKHPIVSPKNHWLTDLIAQHIHVKHLHIGPQSLLNTMRQRYWPIGGRNLVRRIFHKCVKCFKANPKGITQLMGNLPTSRVTPTLRPFVVTGIDYCGPFFVKLSRKRGIIAHKCYVSLFVCFSTKAIHLELVEDLTSNSFIAALRRFIARRGCPKEIFSDNGTNFVGADRDLKELAEMFKEEVFKSKIVDSVTQEGIKWHFQPPSAPHFGGLWESSVKLVKSHMKRVIGCSTLTIIEFSTLLTQIEACVNSRPLTSMSEQPLDLLPLTPAHFLIGDVFTSLPEPNLQPIPINHLNHWQQIQKQVQHFWSRWSKEYLNNLQQRPKWTKATPNVTKNDLVVIKDDNLPPLQWKMARVIKLHHGLDGQVRVVTLKTPSGTLKRPITKICVLPKP